MKFISKILVHFFIVFYYVNVDVRTATGPWTAGWGPLIQKVNCHSCTCFFLVFFNIPFVYRTVELKLTNLLRSYAQSVERLVLLCRVSDSVGVTHTQLTSVISGRLLRNGFFSVFAFDENWYVMIILTKKHIFFFYYFTVDFLS